MGVHGLWTVVQPCARPVKLETLAQKRLAVDASIWIYQFLKAVRDKEGNALRNSHIVGFFRRIIKLLFHGIRPVFVFDGGAPLLKKQTITTRKSRREGRKEDAIRTASKLLSLQMQRRAQDEAERRKRQAENRYEEEPVEIIPEKVVYAEEVNQTDQERRQNRQFRKKDAYHLPELDTSIQNMGSVDDYRIMSTQELEEYAKQFEGGEDINLFDFSKIDFDSIFFTSLPAADRYNILNAARLRSRLRMGLSKEQLDKMFPNRLEFSKFQIERVKERNDLTQRLMNLNGMNDDLLNRVAGERNREYMLVKHDGVEGGWALGVVGHKGEREGEAQKNAIIIDDTEKIEVSEDDEWEDEMEEDFEDVPIEGLNRVPKLANNVKRNYDEKVRRAARESRAEMRRKRLARVNDQTAPVFIQDEEISDDEDIQQQLDELAVAESVTTASKAQTNDDDEELQKAIALSLEKDQQEGKREEEALRREIQLSQENDDNDGIDPRLRSRKNGYQDLKSNLGNDGDTTIDPRLKSRGFMKAQQPSTHDLNDENSLDPRLRKGKGFTESMYQNDYDDTSMIDPRLSGRDLPMFDFQAPQSSSNGGFIFEDEGIDADDFDLGMAIEATRALSPANVEKPNTDTSKDIFGGGGNLLPFQTLDFPSGLAGLKKRKEEEAKAKLAANSKGKETLPLPPWFTQQETSALSPGKPAFIDTEQVPAKPPTEIDLTAPSIPIAERNRILNRGDTTIEIASDDDDDEKHTNENVVMDLVSDEEDQTKSGDQIMNLISDDEDEQLKDGMQLDRKTSPPIQSTSEVADRAKAEPPTGDTSQAANQITQSKASNEGEMEISKESRSSPDPALPNTTVNEADDEVVEWSDSDHEQAQASRNIANQPGLERNETLDSIAQDEDDDQEVIGYSDSEDEEMRRQMDVEANEHARFASTFNNKSTEQNAVDFERELKQLRNQQKKDRRDADEVTSVMVTECQQLLKMFGIPYITAPMEAEAQCAELVRLGLVDGIVTDDSDIFLFGGTRVYKNMFNQAKFVECYLTSDLENEYSLDRRKLIRIAHLLGSDYTDGLPGVGPVGALELLAEFNGENGLRDFKTWWDKIQSGLVPPSDEKSAFRKKFRKLSEKLFLPPTFPDERVDIAYLEPEVDKDPTSFEWGVPDLDGLRGYLSSTIGWSAARTDEVLVPVIRDMNRKLIEGTQTNITNFFSGGSGAGAFAPRVREQNKSKRMEHALMSLHRQAVQGGDREQPISLGRQASALDDSASSDDNDQEVVVSMNGKTISGGRKKTNKKGANKTQAGKKNQGARKRNTRDSDDYGDSADDDSISGKDDENNVESKKGNIKEKSRTNKNTNKNTQKRRKKTIE